MIEISSRKKSHMIYQIRSLKIKRIYVSNLRNVDDHVKMHEDFSDFFLIIFVITVGFLYNSFSIVASK